MDIENTIKVMLKGAADHTDIEEIKEKLKKVDAEHRPLRIKLGLDPSAPDIHLGHAVVLRKMKQLQDFLDKYKPEANNMFFATTKAKHCYTDVDYSKFKNEDVFVLFGKETKGLPEDLLQQYIDKTIRIPMRPVLRSLNLSNSVCIIAYEILRQIDFEGLQGESKYFD